MIINEKYQKIEDEFFEHGELSNNIKLLHYGVLLLEATKRLDCNLNELLNAINVASQRQIAKNNLGRAFL